MKHLKTPMPHIRVYPKMGMTQNIKGKSLQILEENKSKSVPPCDLFLQDIRDKGGNGKLNASKMCVLKLTPRGKDKCTERRKMLPLLTRYLTAYQHHFLA